jgi:hypothetical protein
MDCGGKGLVRLTWQEAQHQIELDIKDKIEAQRIDMQCLELESRIPELMDEKLRLYHQ